MLKERYLIEIGTGVDMHGSNMTSAAKKAIKDAMSHCCMAGIQEIHKASVKDIALKVKICCPKPEQVVIDEIKEPIEFYDDIEIILEKGGAAEKGLYAPAMGEGDDLTVAIAIITVYLKRV